MESLLLIVLSKRRPQSRAVEHAVDSCLSFLEHETTPQGIQAELDLPDSALASYYANAKFQSDCGDYVTAAAALKAYCEITQTPGVPGSGPNGMGALWGRLACEVCVGWFSVLAFHHVVLYPIFFYSCDASWTSWFPITLCVRGHYFCDCLKCVSPRGVRLDIC